MLEINKIYNEDCLEGMKKIEDKSVDLILCDLPYGTTKCKWDIIIPFDKLWDEYNRIIKDNGAILLFGIEPFSSYLRLSNNKLYKYDWYWQKDKGTNILNSKKMPMKNIETISVFYNKQPIYNPQMRKGEPYRDKTKNGRLGEHLGKGNLKATGGVNNGERYPLQTIYFSRDCNKRGQAYHPTQKPVALFEYLIKTYTDENMLVLDNCAGSGTTAISCINTNRNFIGFELDKHYFDIAQKRIEEALK